MSGELGSEISIKRIEISADVALTPPRGGWRPSWIPDGLTLVGAEGRQAFL